MKNYVLPTIVLTAVFAAYTAGQNTSKEKPVEPCCCKHLQQIAEDIHAIRLNLEEPFKDPGNITFTNPFKNVEIKDFGTPAKFEPLKIPAKKLKQPR